MGIKSKTKQRTQKFTKRKLFAVTFKGREPRMLLWRKAVYEEWFHYAKLAQHSKRKIPRAFGNLRNFDKFEEWWRDPKYGFELFCEKPVGRLVEEVRAKASVTPEQVLIKVDLRGDPEILLRDFARLLKAKDLSGDYQSNARFQPSRPMKHIAVGARESDYGDFKRENKLRTYRETYLLAQKMPYKDVALKLGWLEGDKDYYRTEHKWIADDRLEYVGMPVTEYQLVLDNRLKKVRRHVQQVEAIFDSIEGGTFP